MTANEPGSVIGRGATLALVTCGPQLEAAVQCGDTDVPSVVRLSGGKPRSTLVLAAVDLLVENSELEPVDIARVVVSRGPGSFTGIRAGLASAAGLAAAIGCRCLAFDSLLMLAARCRGPASVWCAQPGRRGEVYARRFALDDDSVPRPSGEVEILRIGDLRDRGPWSAVETLDLGDAHRADVKRSGAEALLFLSRSGIASGPVEPLYVEGPPIDATRHGR
jgi:tRNA threonylcarbamoyl adenosine modification protein YeaZ